MTLKSGSLKVVETGTTRKLGYGLLFAIHNNYGSILYRFRDKARYPLHLSPPLVESVLEYCHTFWYRKTRAVWLPDSENSLRICLAISAEYQHVTDRETDRHLATSQSALCIALRDTKIGLI